MKTLTNRFIVFHVIMLFAGYPIMGQKAMVTENLKTTTQIEMKTYLIERKIPGAGKLTADELKFLAQKSCAILKEMGSRIQWVHSYVTENAIHCVYKAENIELIKEHAEKCGFPSDAIIEISSTISPATAGYLSKK